MKISEHFWICHIFCMFSLRYLKLCLEIEHWLNQLLHHSKNLERYINNYFLSSYVNVCHVNMYYEFVMRIKNSSEKPLFILIHIIKLKWHLLTMCGCVYTCAQLLGVCVCAQLLNHVPFFTAPWTVACQAPLSVKFSRQEYWSGLPCFLPGDLPDSGIKPMCLLSPALVGRFFITRATCETPIVPAAAAAAKSLQSCPTLCDPIDSSPPGSPVPGILQARTLDWVAISFSNAWKWKGKGKSLRPVRLLATPWTAAYHSPPSMGFSRQEYWSVMPLPSLSAYYMLNLVLYIITLHLQFYLLPHELSSLCNYVHPAFYRSHLPHFWNIWKPTIVILRLP